MAFRRKTSATAESSRQRLTGLKTVESSLDFGNGLSNSVYEAKIVEMEAALEAYNSKLSEADHARNIFEAKEAEVLDLYKRMLSGVGVRYGFDSSQYEVAGGTRTSDRKRTSAKKAEV